MEPDPTTLLKVGTQFITACIRYLFPVNVVGIWNQIPLHVLKVGTQFITACIRYLFPVNVVGYGTRSHYMC